MNNRIKALLDITNGEKKENRRNNSINREYNTLERKQTKRLKRERESERL